MGERFIYMLRHGHFDRDEQSKKKGHLTSLGEKQASYAIKRLKEIKFDIAHVSTAIRTQQTAKIVLKGVKPKAIKNSRLLVEGLPCFPLAKAKKIKVDGKKISKDTKRAASAFEKFFIPYKPKGTRNELIVGHGNMIRYYMMRALGVDPKKWTKLDILQCSLSIIEISEDGSMKLISFNEVGHIPMSKRTFI